MRALLVGTTVVDEAGSPALQTSVERKVYDRNGRLLYDDHWSSHYRGDYRIVRVGTKKPPPPPVKTDHDEGDHDDGDDDRSTTTTGKTTTAATTTTPATTTQP